MLQFKIIKMKHTILNKKLQFKREVRNENESKRTYIK